MPVVRSLYNAFKQILHTVLAQQNRAVGKPVLIGRSTYNFALAAEQALECGAARQIGSADELIVAAAELLRDEAARGRMGEAGRAFAARHRGATAKTIELISRAMR